MTVTLIAAQSLDGRITRHHQPGSDFTSKADKAYFPSALRNFDCRVLGSATYESRREGTQKSAAKGRYHLVLTRNPERYSSEVLKDALEFTDHPPALVHRALKEKGYQRCALIGGSKVHAAFLRAGLVDEFWITLEPMVFGGGVPLVDGEVNTSLKLLSVEHLSADTLLLKYSVSRP